MVYWLDSKNNNFQWVSDWRLCSWMGFIQRFFIHHLHSPDKTSFLSFLSFIFFGQWISTLTGFLVKISFTTRQNFCKLVMHVTHRLMSSSLSNSWSMYVLKWSISFLSTLNACCMLSRDVYISPTDRWITVRRLQLQQTQTETFIPDRFRSRFLPTDASAPTICGIFHSHGGPLSAPLFPSREWVLQT